MYVLGVFPCPSSMFVHYVCEAGRFPPGLKCWWEVVQSVAAISCGQIAAHFYLQCVAFWLNGPFQHLDTQSSRDRPPPSFSLCLPSLSLFLSLSFFPLSRQTNGLFVSLCTHSFIQCFEVQLDCLWPYLVKSLSGNSSRLSRSESGCTETLRHADRMNGFLFGV